MTVARTFRRSRARILWTQVRDSLWFLPGVLTSLAVAAAFLLVRLDRNDLRLPDGYFWFFGGGAEGARGVLSAIAGGLITVTGVVFSVTIVALQLASTQFTPRVLRNFTADRANQLVLGVFISTFTYTLLVLRSVRSAEAGREPFVPAVSVGIAVLLVLVSIGFLIFFVHHAARSIQASFIVARVAREALGTMAEVLPELREGRLRDRLEPPEDAPMVVRAGAGGYIQSVDEARLIALARRHELRIRLENRIGAFVMAGEPIASVWPAGGEDVGRKVHAAVVLGPERTPEQDVEFGIIELADIAVKALSPSINDPTTAMLCIDHLGGVLAAWGRRDGATVMTRLDGDVVRLAWPVTGFDRALGLAFDPILHFGAANPAITKRLLDVLGRVLRLLPDEQRGPVRSLMLDIERRGRAELPPGMDPAEVGRVARSAVSEPGPKEA